MTGNARQQAAHEVHVPNTAAWSSLFTRISLIYTDDPRQDSRSRRIHIPSERRRSKERGVLDEVFDREGVKYRIEGFNGGRTAFKLRDMISKLLR